MRTDAFKPKDTGGHGSLGAGGQKTHPATMFGGLRTPVQEIALGLIVPNPDQPRRRRDPKADAELKASIAEKGLLRPLLVKPLEGGCFMLLGGERRHRVLTELGRAEALCILKNGDHKHLADLALHDNLGQLELSDYEKTAYLVGQVLPALLELNPSHVPPLLNRLRNRPKGTPHGAEEALQAAIIERVLGPLSITLSSFCTHFLPLLNLPQPLIAALNSGSITSSQARKLSGLKNLEDLNRLLGRCIAEGWSTAQATAEVNKVLGRKPVFTTNTILRMARTAQVEGPQRRKLDELLHEVDTSVAAIQRILSEVQT